MHLIPVSITVLKNESSIGQNGVRDAVNITFEIEVVGCGDFSDFLVDGKIDSDKIVNEIFRGKVAIANYWLNTSGSYGLTITKPSEGTTTDAQSK